MTAELDTTLTYPPHGDCVYEVGLEGVQFTLVDVHDGYDEAFNTWYETDHFYAGGTLIPWVLAGRRWYAGQAHRAARYVGERCPFPEPQRGTNLATYWLTVGGLDGFREWMGPQLVALRGRGRMFAHRTHINTDAYRFRSVIESESSSGVRPHVALDHPFRSLLVAYAAPGTVSSASSPLPRGGLLLAFDREVVQMDASQLGMSAGLDQPDLSAFDPVSLLLLFGDAPASSDAGEVATLTRAACAAAGLEALWGGSFAPVRPGSTEHLSEMRTA
jgi:hypothetical protein